MEKDIRMPQVGEIYKHFKGNKYVILNTATCSETLQELVVYREVGGEEKIWVRPLSSWLEKAGEETRFELWSAPAIVNTKKVISHFIKTDANRGPEKECVLLGLSNNLNEHNILNLVECLGKNMYRNYLVEPQYSEFVFESPQASFESLLQHLGIYHENPFPVPNPDDKDYERQKALYDAMQEKVGPYYIFIEK